MKKFLVPALLLSLVGVAAAIAAGSSSASPASSGAGECHKFTMGGAVHCPMSAEKCEEKMGGEACPEMAGESCPDAAGDADCMKKCEDKQELDCCKKKMECGDCPKSNEPAEKP